MVLVRLHRFGPLVEAISRLAQIAKHADVIFMPGYAQFITSHRSPRFLATLQMPENFFSYYFINYNNDPHPSSLSLESFHDALLECTFCSSMTIYLLPTNTDQLLLRFEAPHSECRLRHKYLPLLPPQETNIEDINYEKYFSIDSQHLRCVIKNLPISHDHSVCVTITRLQVKFFVGSAEIIFTKKGGQCEIEGYRGEDETQIKIILNPMLFFIDLTYDVDRVYFYNTIKNSYGVMLLPVSELLFAEYLFYFPQI